MILSTPNDIEALKELIVKLIGRVEALEQEKEALAKKLLTRIQKLEQENQELCARLHQKSRNSHRPPSSEGLRKKSALPKKKKRIGGPKGHPGKTPGMSNVPNQMMNYFNTQTSLSRFEFQFDPGRWVPSPSDLNQALEANTNLLDTSKWSNYQQMFQFADAQVAPNDINGLIDFITANKFNDIINP